MNNFPTSDLTLIVHVEIVKLLVTPCAIITPTIHSQHYSNRSRCLQLRHFSPLPLRMRGKLAASMVSQK